VLREAVVLLKGTTELDANVTIDGKSRPVSADGGFTAELELEEGTNSIVITAGDAAGNVATLTVDLTYEPEGPEEEGDDGSGWSAAVMAAVLVALVAAGFVVWRLRTRGV
jgi:hypothetical protein